MVLQNTVHIADNCDKTAPILAAFNAGNETIENMPEGASYLVNQDGQIVSSAAIAAKTKNFYIVTKNNSRIIKTPNIPISGFTSLVGYLPKYFVSERRAIGDITGINVPGFTAVAGKTYGIGVKVFQFKNPEKPECQFTQAVRAPESGTNLKGYVFTNLVERLMNSNRADYYLSAYAHTDAAEVASVTATITKGSKYGTYSVGTLTAGMHVAYTGTVAGDSRTQPRGVYRVVSVDAANGTFEIGHPWQADSIAATAISTVALDDGDEWGMIITTERREFTDVRYPVIIQPKLKFYTEDFSTGEVLAKGAEVDPVHETGHWWDVARYQRDNYPQNLPDFPAESTTKGYYYSNVQLTYTNTDDRSEIQTQVKNGFVEVYIQGPTTAELLAGTSPTYKTNITEGVSDYADSTVGALMNGLNLLAIEAGILAGAANTVNNEGNALTDTVDF